jgi:NAD(P)-dependent dehydrogenase (short-subunit alcohol dehydrogenase family)
MSNYNVVITGSAVGIGRGVAIAYAGLGATIVALDIDDQENEITKQLVTDAGGTCLTFNCDVGDRLAVKAVFDSLSLNKIDLLLNNAAVWNNTTLTGGDYDQQTQAYDHAMGSCVFGAFYCSMAAVPLLELAPEPNIINIITDHVKVGHYITGAPATGYDCAKFSLWRLTESWAVELADKGIRVNGLCFGATDTPMLRGVSPEAAERGMVPADIADAVMRVVNQGAGGDTGTSYFFGGGPTPRATSLEQIANLRDNLL